MSVCLGDRLPALLREFMLPCEGVERRESLGGGGLAGRLGGPAVTEPKLLFLLEGGMSEEGSSAGTGSFSSARYTRCMAWGWRLGRGRRALVTRTQLRPTLLFNANCYAIRKHLRRNVYD